MPSTRFSYVRYDQTATKMQQEFRDKFEELEKLAETLAPSRPQSLVMTKLEEAYMWVGKAIRDDQIKRQGKVDEEPSRSNS